MSIHALHDDHGRTVRYLRLSLTDRCNLRCLYCHSNARHQCIPHEKVLRYEEMIRLVQIVRGMGVGKVRLTGGEPFARKGCERLPPAGCGSASTIWTSASLPTARCWRSTSPCCSVSASAP